MAIKATKKPRIKETRTKGPRTKGPRLVIDLGSYSLTFMVGVQSQNSIKISKCFDVKTPTGAYSNGRIENFEALSTAIKQALSEHQVKAKDTIITFTSTEVIQREMTVPKLSYEDTIGVIRYDISQYLPINIDDYDITYMTISSILENGIEKYNVVAYVVKKQTVDVFYELIKSCGLNPVALDLHSNAIAKFHNFVMSGSGAGKNLMNTDAGSEIYAYIDIGYNNLLIDIVSSGQIVLSRSIGIGFYAQDKLISDTFGVTLEEAEEFRREKISNEIEQLKELYEEIKLVDLENPEIELALLNFGNDEQTMDEKKALFIVLRDCMRQYDLMASEIAKVLQYYVSRSEKNHVDRVIFHGSSAENTGLIHYLRGILGYESSSVNFDEIKNVQFPDNINKKFSYCYSIGALIRRKEA